MRRARWAEVLMVVVLGLGGLTACGDDGGSGDPDPSGTDTTSDGGTDTTPTTSAGSTDTTGGEAATGVEGYCEAVQAYVGLLGEAIDDPSGAGVELQEAANAYIEAAVNLGELSAEDQARFDECAQEAADAAASFVPGG